MRRPVAALVVVGAAVCGCGGGPSDEEQVRSTVDAFGRATAAKDYRQICDRLLAPQLVEKVRSVGLSCEAALKRGLGDVRDPKLTIGKVTVNGESARVEVRTSATGEPATRGALKLTRLRGQWRIASLE